jgi:hypothetical protein
MAPFQSQPVLETWIVAGLTPKTTTDDPPKIPSWSPLTGLPDGSTPSPMASRPSIGTKFNSVQRDWTKFLLGKSEGLTHSADGVVTPHRGGSAGLPGQLGQAGAPAGQRRTQSRQGVLGACVPVCMAGAQGWTGVARCGPGGWGALVGLEWRCLFVRARPRGPFDKDNLG